MFLYRLWLQYFSTHCQVYPVVLLYHLTVSVEYLLHNILPVSLGTLPESEMLSNIKQGAEMMDFSRKRSRIIQINAVPRRCFVFYLPSIGIRVFLDDFIKGFFTKRCFSTASVNWRVAYIPIYFYWLLNVVASVSRFNFHWVFVTQTMLNSLSHENSVKITNV